jgi:hypothetical protein
MAIAVAHLADAHLRSARDRVGASFSRFGWLEPPCGVGRSFNEARGLAFGSQLFAIQGHTCRWRAVDSAKVPGGDVVVPLIAAVTPPPGFIGRPGAG